MPPADSPKAYLFGPFRLEVEERRLLREGQVVPLLGKAFDTLVLLAEGAGTLQKQQVLIDKLWPDVVVEPNNLQQNISLVRRALSGVPSVEIETVRGQGYRLHAEVRAVRDEPAPATLQHAPNASPEGPRLARARGQRIQFCAAEDGARLAYARLGDGPPLVKVANRLSHLELDWHSPIWTHWLERLSRDHCLVRYDARGNGLSDWAPPAIRCQDFTSDLRVVFDAAGVKRAPVLGISQALRSPWRLQLPFPSASPRSFSSTDARAGGASNRTRAFRSAWRR